MTAVSLKTAARALERAGTTVSLGDGSLHTPALVPRGVAHVSKSTVASYDALGHANWSRDLGSELSAPAGSSDGDVYVCSDDGHLYGFDASGSQTMKVPVAVDHRHDPVVGPDGTVYVVTQKGRLEGYRPDGERRFSKKVKPFWFLSLEHSKPGTSAAIGPDGTVVVADEKRFVTAFEPDGDRKWTYRLPQQLMTGPTFGPAGRVGLGVYLDEAIVLNARGREQHRAQVSGVVSSGLGFGEDGSFTVGGGDGHLHGFDPWGKQKWVVKGDSKFVGTPVVADGTVYAASWFGKLYAVDAGCGSSELKADTGMGLAVGSPRFDPANGNLYMNVAGRSLMALHTRPLVDPTPEASEPTVDAVDGWLLVGDHAVAINDER